MAQSTWTGTGDWVNSPSNWSNGVPDSSTSATISSGTVTVSTSDATAYDVLNQSVIEISSSGVLTVTSTFTNSTGATLIVDYGGTLTVSDHTVLEGGSTVVLSDGVILSPGPIELTSTSTYGAVAVTVNGSDTATILSDIQDGDTGDSLLKNGSGTLILTGTNTYTGGTTISGGVLEIGTESNIGSGGITLDGGELLTNATGTITQGVTLNTGSTDSLGVLPNITTTYTGDIVDGNGSGSLTIGDSSGNSTGTLILTGSNTYTGGTTITSGVLEISSASNIGTGGITLNGGELLLSTDGTLSESMTLNTSTTNALAAASGSTLTYSGTIADGNGSGNLSINDTSGNDGIVVLDGVNTYSGTTTVASGTLVVAAGSTIADSNAVNLANSGATLDLSASGTTQSINNLSGSAGSTLYLGGNNLTITNTAGAVNTFSGVIADGGLSGGTGSSLTIAGSGELILDGANTYTGGTTITGGTLVVDNVSSLGTGDVYNIGTSSTPATLESNSSSTGTVMVITVNGNYTQGTNGVLYLNITGTGTSAGTDYDTLSVSGSTSLGGALSLNFINSVSPMLGQHYVVVTSGSSITGSFTSTENNLGSGYKWVVSYNNTFNGTEPDNSAIATLIAQLGATGGLTHNQQAVANYVDQYDSVVTSGDFFNNIVPALNTASLDSTQLQNALDQLSPQKIQIFSTAAFNNYSFTTQSLTSHLANVRDGDYGLDTSALTMTDPSVSPALSQIKSHLLAWNPPPTPGLLSDSTTSPVGALPTSDPKQEVSPGRSPDKNWSTFVSGNVVLADVNNNSDVSNASYTTSGMLAGADYRITPNIRVGALFGYQHTNASLDNLGSQAHIDTFQPGIYLAYANQYGFYGNGLVSYAYNSYSESRNISFLSRTASGSTSGGQFGINLNGGYDFHSNGGWTFGPSVGLSYVNLNIDSYSESGAGAAGLNVDSQNAQSLRSLIGGNVRYVGKVGPILLIPHFSASWQHEFLNNSRTITSQFQQTGMGSFGVQTTGADRDSALLDLGLDIQVNDAWTVFIDSQANVGANDFQAVSAQGGAKLAF